MTENEQVRKEYGSDEGIPTILLTSGDHAMHGAWEHYKGEWHKANPSDVAHKSRVMSKAEFEKAYPDLPPLPGE